MYSLVKYVVLKESATCSWKTVLNATTNMTISVLKNTRGNHMSFSHLMVKNKAVFSKIFLNYMDVKSVVLNQREKGFYRNR